MSQRCGKRPRDPENKARNFIGVYSALRWPGKQLGQRFDQHLRFFFNLMKHAKMTKS